MRLQRLIPRIYFFICCILMAGFLAQCVQAQPVREANASTIDHVYLVMEQINLLKSRLSQGAKELADLQQLHDKEIPSMPVEKASKNLLDKVALDISVAKSNLDSINIELTDCRQTISWLEKSIQEYENQLNVLNIFGTNITKNETVNIKGLRDDLAYQQKLLVLEKSRADYLHQLQSVAANILSLRNDNYGQINRMLKSRHLLQIKEQQVKDELAYQQQQNHWLQQLNQLYAQSAALDPVKDREAYTTVERKIFYANENANFAYVQSLIARYRDQIQQMNLAVLRTNSISLLNEIGDQAQGMNKQISRLDSVLKSRSGLLEKHITYLSHKKTSDEQLREYVEALTSLNAQYEVSEAAIGRINNDLTDFRSTLDHALQNELSARQGFPSFGFRMWLDMGKEMLLVPALTFQMGKSLSSHLFDAFHATSLLGWGMFALVEALMMFAFFFLYKIVRHLLKRPSQWREKLNSKWFSLRWLQKNVIDVFLLLNLVCGMLFFDVPYQNFELLVYLGLVWVVFKSIYMIARLTLVETTHDTSGHDMRLFHRLKWIILVGGVITALTVYMHQLPLIYELKNLCDRLFLVLLMVVSLLLLRSWRVVPNLILSHIESRHPYLEKSIRFIGILIPALIFGNSVIGVFGYLNLIMTISWYEGLFLIVLIGYLMLRGLLSDGLEQISRLLIQYVSNGWLLSEAFLKPLDKVLRITLFFSAGAVLFVLYGWDKQSSIVERLTWLLHYQLVNVLNTTITPLNIIALFVVISVFYWTAKWTREFVYRLLSVRTKDMGIRNSIAILSQYSVVVLGAFICLRVLGINLGALAMVASMFAFGVGLGLRDLANNFACGFLILLERPLRVGDIVNIGGVEGEVINIGSRAVTVRTNDHMELVVPNAEIFNKSFTNWTARDNVVRTITHVKISRHDNPHEVKMLIQKVLSTHPEVLKDPAPEVYLRHMNEILLEFEVRYFVNIRQVLSRTKIVSAVLMRIWDEFNAHGIKPPYPQQEIILRKETADQISALQIGLAAELNEHGTN